VSHPVTVHPDPAVVGEISGRPVVLSYSSAATEYEALRRHAVLVDRSHRARIRFSGAKAAEVLTGLVTNDVLALTSGQGQYAAALTPKGRVVADVRIFADESSLLVDCPPRAAEGWTTMVKKYVNPRLAAYADETSAQRDLGVFGPQARHVVSELTGINATALTALAPYAFAVSSVDGARVLVARVPELATDGFELFLPAEQFNAIWERAVAAGATPAGLEAWEIARVEAGRPEWGIDIDDTTIPQEANLDELHAISYTKGCYVGQEVVARVHFRGHVNRHLRGLRSAAEEPPATGATLHDAEGKHVGDVRSAVGSPRLGSIALGMVRREIELGTQLLARWEGGESRVDVSHLPFPA
jgi:tRNA-modifying protein YgfZ